jgi:hypothetical protein
MFTRTNPKLNPEIELPENVFPAAFDRVPQAEGQNKLSAITNAHDDLLSYLLARMDSDTDRPTRMMRYAKMDRIISTWQRLSKEDSARKQKQDDSGKAQATSMNLPVTHSHVDDMTAFFAEVYSPSSGSYFSTPDPAQAAETKKITDKMNEDAKASGFYTPLTSGIRSLLKYNIGGFHLEWLVEDIDADSEDMSKGLNWASNLDMYNFFWDQSVKDPKKIRLDAEWAAHVDTVNRRHLIRREQNGQYAGVQHILVADQETASLGTSTVQYYKYPPIESRVSAVDDETDQSAIAVDWSQYGKSLGAATTELKNSYERITMYCWLNPADFGLSTGNESYPDDGYFLWRFTILNGERIIAATAVNKDSVAVSEQGKVVIPYYVGFLNVDDMLGSQRSIAELLAPFQSFTSFLLNAHVAGARSSIWGIKGYDPQMFDMSSLDAADGTSGYVVSKMPGRDVRSGLTEIKGTFDGAQTMSQMGDMMNLMQGFFPAQALPNQVANMDRAIQSQVAAVLQGVSRRLHMLVRNCDEAIFGPLRFDEYRNMVKNEAVSVSGITDGQVRKAIGSGLEQLNREIVEAAIRQLLFAMIQNPQVTQQYDLSSMFQYWGSLLKMPVDLAQFKLQPQVAPVTPGAPGTPAAAQPEITPPIPVGPALTGG